jgi:hypothetical protein
MVNRGVLETRGASTGGISPLWLGAAFATMSVMLSARVAAGAYALRRTRTKD